MSPDRHPHGRRPGTSSMSSLNCGVSFWPLGRTATRLGFCIAMPRSWLRAAISLSWPSPPRSWSSRSKPLATPSSITAGGEKAKARPSRNLRKGPHGPAGDGRRAFSSGLCRSFQSLSLTKASPMFWPRPAKLKPATVITPSTVFFSSSMKVLLHLPDHLDGSILGRSGRQLDLADEKPWSSSGRKAVGS